MPRPWYSRKKEVLLRRSRRSRVSELFSILVVAMITAVVYIGVSVHNYIFVIVVVAYARYYRVPYPRLV
jgi:hypothetical protein